MVRKVISNNQLNYYVDRVERLVIECLVLCHKMAYLNLASEISCILFDKSRNIPKYPLQKSTDSKVSCPVCLKSCARKISGTVEKCLNDFLQVTDDRTMKYRTALVAVESAR